MTTLPAYHQHEEFQNRATKLKEIRDLGIDPFPAKFSPDQKAGPLLERHDGEEVGDSAAGEAGTTPPASIAGRLVLFRAMGKNAFGQLQDSTGRMQVMFNRDTTLVEDYDPSKAPASQPLSHIKFIEKKLDLGDIIGVEGHLFRTGKGELTLYAKKVVVLCKTLLPLADKHSGLHDKELRYRKRWLDLISNPDVADTFRTRSKILRLIRSALEAEDFMEVETPCLQNIYGGAQARPFTTVLNSLDQEMFLRISLEISLKKLIIGGMDRVYEIGKVFRNEGVDRTHNPEFTMLEAYAAYWDYNDMMVFIEDLFESVAKELFNSTKVPVALDHNGTVTEIDMKAPWKRITMKDSVKEYAGIDIDAHSDDELRTLLIEKGDEDPLVVNKKPRGLLISGLFEALVEDKLIQPHHIIDHPIETTPLCKLHRDPTARAEGIVERFESFICGREICNSYSELNDPELQRSLLEDQSDQREAGDEEASPLDEEFIEAVCQGMPPTGGIGIGIDRMVMLFTNAASIRDVLYFPLMKTTEESSPQE